MQTTLSGCSESPGKTLNSPTNNQVSLLSPKSCYTNNDEEFVIKMDSACGHNMTGTRSRIIHTQPAALGTSIKGFNNSVTQPQLIGTNPDGEDELYVRGMPQDLTLLCAHTYSRHGAIVLLEDGGAVLSLNPTEALEFRTIIDQYRSLHNLKVVNHTGVSLNRL